MRIAEDLSQREGPNYAEAILLRLWSAAARLADMPGMGHLREDLTDEDVRFWPVCSFLIVYRPGTEPLEIVRLVNGRRDLAALLRR